MPNLFEEGLYLDLWSVPHFLFGLIVFIFFIDKKFRLELSFLFTAILAIGWEIFEIRVKVTEVYTNRITDVVLTLLGFVLLAYLNKKTNFMTNPIVKDTAWRYIVIFWILINALGWMSYTFL